MRPLPLRTPDPKEIITLHINDEPEPARPAAPELKVLLLEDRDDFRQVLHEYMVSRSYEVTSVQTGIEGLRKVMESRFDLIVCDMLMPNMGGEMFYWAVTRVRPATRDRFIFFTGHKNNPKIDFFFERINATVLFKPFKLSELDTAIADVFRKSQ